MKKYLFAVFLLVAMVAFSSPANAIGVGGSAGVNVGSGGGNSNYSTSARTTASGSTSITDLSARIKALIDMVNDLKKKIEELKHDANNPGEGGSHATSTHATSTVDVKICKNFMQGGRGLSRGMSGDDVRETQEFLRSTGDLDEEATGYFGEKTENALRNWQAREGIVSNGDRNSTGWGMVGVKTRAAMYRRCNDGNHDPVPNDDDGHAHNLKVTPESGAVPLAVVLSNFPHAVEAKVNACKYSPATRGGDKNGLTVNWGDGTSAPQIADSTHTASTSCTDDVTKHTYTTTGTKTITVRSWHAGPNDAPVTDWSETVKVRVTATSTATTTVSLKVGAASKARVALSKKLHKSVGSIKVTAVEAKEWTDGCLGLGGAAESCLAAITPGYRVTLKRNDTTYYARTNKSGSVVRFEE